ncbi:hypothetical protein CTH_10018 (plasmid) [Carboxydocella thermautotrophica]|nr:hypothetical protein CTH_10018 [Carboxydocella thermautotrophica]
MRLTAADLMLIRWINKYKRATAYQMAQYLGVCHQNVYRRLKRLVDNGYLVHEQIFYAQPGVYYPTHKGVSAAGDVLSPARVNLVEYEHDLKVVDVALHFEKKYGYWKSEREIRSEKGITGFGVQLHIPDGITRIGDEYVGIEVELTRKGKERLKKIFMQHLRSTDYSQVWYLVGDENIRQHLLRNMDQRVKSIVKIFDLKEVESL